MRITLLQKPDATDMSVACRTAEGEWEMLSKSVRMEAKSAIA